MIVTIKIVDVEISHKTSSKIRLEGPNDKFADCIDVGVVGMEIISSELDFSNFQMIHYVDYILLPITVSMHYKRKLKISRFECTNISHTRMHFPFFFRCLKLNSKSFPFLIFLLLFIYFFCVSLMSHLYKL